MKLSILILFLLTSLQSFAGFEVGNGDEIPAIPPSENTENSIFNLEHPITIFINIWS